MREEIKESYKKYVRIKDNKIFYVGTYKNETVLLCNANKRALKTLDCVRNFETRFKELDK